MKKYFLSLCVLLVACGNNQALQSLTDADLNAEFDDDFWLAEHERDSTLYQQAVDRCQRDL